jgi:peptide/nickel transport system ATP-binding protein
LRKLTDEHGISICYITHNLATAYQVSDSILVLYRTHLAEAGGVEQVVTAPCHPYTQLLVSEIPRADTARGWLTQDEESRRDGLALSTAGCSLAERRPFAMPACLAAPPGVYRTEPRRAVACVHYKDYPTLPRRDPGAVLSI